MSNKFFFIFKINFLERRGYYSDSETDFNAPYK